VMADISHSRTISAEPQAIWDKRSDFGAISSWVDKVDHSCLLEHRGGPKPKTSQVKQLAR
jgi:hypothetical protein